MYTADFKQIKIEDVVNKICDFYNNTMQYDTPFHIAIGTDSQNFKDTKVVSVITAWREGHGGIYFSDIERINKIQNVREKLNYETQRSLTFADHIMSIFESDNKYEDLYMNSNFVIHVDAGNNNNGKTKELIPSLTGWVRSCGYECEVKPNSYAASSIADKISK